MVSVNPKFKARHGLETTRTQATELTKARILVILVRQKDLVGTANHFRKRNSTPPIIYNVTADGPIH